jgi:hypothetical protein
MPTTTRSSACRRCRRLWPRNCCTGTDLKLSDCRTTPAADAGAGEAPRADTRGAARARSHRRFAWPLIIRFIPDYLLSKVLYSVPLYLKRQRDRTLGAVRRRALGLAVRPDVSLPARARARGRLRGDADENNGAHHSPARSSGVPFKGSCRSVAVSAFGKRSGNTTASGAGYGDRGRAGAPLRPAEVGARRDHGPPAPGGPAGSAVSCLPSRANPWHPSLLRCKTKTCTHELKNQSQHSRAIPGLDMVWHNKRTAVIRVSRYETHHDAC